MTSFTKLRKIDSKGIQSVVDLGFVAKRQAIRKRFAFGLSSETLFSLIKDIKSYREKVEGAGFNIPKNFDLLIGNSRNNLYLESIDEYLGNSSLDKLAFDGGLSDTCLKKFLIAWEELIKGMVFNARLCAEKRTLLDAKPENFLFKERLFYVDFYPPILISLNGNIQLFETGIFQRSLQEPLKFKFGEIRGVLTRLLFMLKGQCLESVYEKAYQLTLEIVGDFLAPDIIHYIERQKQEDFPYLKQFNLSVR